MRTTTTLENVINLVHEQSAGHYDEIIAVRDMRFDSLERMTIMNSKPELERNL